METKMLTANEVLAINEKFGLDLSYEDATHYRAAQVIWTLSKPAGLHWLKALSLEANPAADSPTADQAPEGTA